MKEPKPCPAVRARDSVMRHAKPGRERQSVDPGFVLRCKPATRRGDKLSLVERGKAETQALSCGANPQLVKENR